jgi:cytoskeletal protein CcmA (bactofilin family)
MDPMDTVKSDILQTVKDSELSANKSTTTNSVIGKDNTFSGEFRSDGLLRIDGNYRGVVKGYGVVLVGEAGKIVGDIYARSVRIGGKIKGNVYALDRVDILSTGKLVGDLMTKKCFAEEGMHFTGQGKIVPQKELEAVFEKNVKNTTQLTIEDF